MWNLYSLVIPPRVIHDFTDTFRIESLLLKLLQTSSSRFVPLRRFFKIRSDAGAMNLNGTVPKDLHGYRQTLINLLRLSSFEYLYGFRIELIIKTSIFFIEIRAFQLFICLIQCPCSIYSIYS